jgi:hypothetical protein
VPHLGARSPGSHVGYDRIRGGFVNGFLGFLVDEVALSDQDGKLGLQFTALLNRRAPHQSVATKLRAVAYSTSVRSLGTPRVALAWRTPNANRQGHGASLTAGIALRRGYRIAINRIC